MSLPKNNTIPQPECPPWCNSHVPLAGELPDTIEHSHALADAWISRRDTLRWAAGGHLVYRAGQPCIRAAGLESLGGELDPTEAQEISEWLLTGKPLQPGTSLAAQFPHELSKLKTAARRQLGAELGEAVAILDREAQSILDQANAETKALKAERHPLWCDPPCSLMWPGTPDECMMHDALIYGDPARPSEPLAQAHMHTYPDYSTAYLSISSHQDDHYPAARARAFAHAILAGARLIEDPWRGVVP